MIEPPVPRLKAKCLVVRPPYCVEIATGEKTEEYRSWTSAYRGPLIIAASKTKDSGPMAGCAFCVVDLVDIKEAGPKDFVWLLANPRLFYPVPIKGRLGLFDVDVETDFDVVFEFSDG